MNENKRPTTFIYALEDPRNDCETRYIGKSDFPLRRLAKHIKEAERSVKSTHKSNWIRSLLADGVLPQISILAEVPKDGWDSEEIYQIALWKELGNRLTNSTRGGDGGATMTGKIHSPETRVKMSAWQKGKQKSADHIAKMSAGASGKKQSPQTIAKRVTSRGAKPLSPEHRAKLSTALKGKTLSPEHRAKIKAGWHAAHKSKEQT